MLKMLYNIYNVYKYVIEYINVILNFYKIDYFVFLI